MIRGNTPLNNISDWLSFLNERITSYESAQNTLLTLIGVILALVIAMTGINLTVKPNDTNILTGNWLPIIFLFMVGLFVFIFWIIERKYPDLPYQQALRIRSQILKGTLSNPNDICQQCIDKKIL